jgi:hypothetical protein
MKNALFILLIGFSYQLFAQSSDALINSMKSISASGIAKHFEQNIEMTLLTQSGTFSKAQAEVVLKDFLTRNGVKSFELKHQGASPEGAKYFVGTFTTPSNSFNAYVYGKQSGSIFLVRELRVEEK